MRGNRAVFESAATAVIVGCAVAMLVLYVQNLGTRRAMSAATVASPSWKTDNERGIWIGPEDARMVVTEFFDYTCGYCRRLAPVIDSILLAFPEDVAVAFHHFPLGSGSYPSAIAGECAERQGRFLEVSKAIYAQAESIGTRSWAAFAREAGIRDVGGFETCMEMPLDSFPRIAVGQELGARTGVTGTPTVWVNGVLFGGRDVASFMRRAEELGIASAGGER